MPAFPRLLFLLALMLPLAARAAPNDFQILADDGDPIANHRVPPEVAAQIEKLPGVVVVGNPQGSLTLAEFYDVNCPYCRWASADIDALLKKNPRLRLVLVPFPVLGVPSIQATRVELAVARLAPPEKFYAFHRTLDMARGTVDGTRALAAAASLGLDQAKVLAAANDDALADVMKAHVRLGDALEIAATPGFVIAGVAIVGYPGAKRMAAIIAAVERCGAVVCAAAGAPGPKRR
jgi:protein-disulfide isomerase